MSSHGHLITGAQSKTWKSFANIVMLLAEIVDESQRLILNLTVNFYFSAQRKIILRVFQKLLALQKSQYFCANTINYSIYYICLDIFLSV